MSYYRITFILPDGTKRTVVRAAHSIWHAIDLVYTKHRWVQPDRTQYSARRASA